MPMHLVKPSVSSSALSQLINNFLVETYNGYPEAAQTLVVITHKDWSLYNDNEALLSPEEATKQGSKALTHGGGPMKVPSRPPWTETFDPPCLGQSPDKAAQSLLEANKAPGSLSRDYCIILDEQTLGDRSVLLVKTQCSPGERLPCEHGDSSIVVVRASFKEANGIIQSVSVGHGSLAEILWNQQHTKDRL
ncbi:hypothetical protein M409DRAFT_28772 [Zasmidium cellare ATCC 36951]|uniref:Uncharacterized protein n=1 Tax=Zasmidium cellare ATCC 36951 TaxID=1080233 RepID=A0A6A6C4V5_ZASCE|nr:uncharacterized protein M409DRAFT_28772 [Zasmidium cellare ATCC 36951]KAF2160892.1 hypothetical protein M409DRAFT_28772 [Zasmidium cellare ATCC 36951]